jgi:hypothetical protein
MSNAENTRVVVGFVALYLIDREIKSGYIYTPLATDVCIYRLEIAG